MPLEDLVLEAAKDYHVLIAILFFLGIYLIFASMAEFQLGPIKSISTENQRKAFLSGIAIAGLSGFILVALLINSMGVEVSGSVTYADVQKLPVKYVDVKIGAHNGMTNAEGIYKIADVPRNERQIMVIIAGKSYPDMLDMPMMWPWEDKKISIMPINLSVSGEVSYDEGYPVEGAYVNISGARNLSTTTDSMGKFDFGNLEVGFVLPKPLTFDVRLRTEPRPRNKTDLKIPKEEPYAIYLPVTLHPKDWVDVSGYVRLHDNIIDRNPKGIPSVVVTMGGRTAQTRDDGGYFINKVPIETTEYALWFADGKRLSNRTIPSRLTDSYFIPWPENLTVYKSELNMS